jgi:DNA-binding transcriptional ArsR family regulator
VTIARALEVVSESGAAAATIDPFRRRLLELLGEPGSATSLAPRVGEPRQKVNYHLRQLERLGLVREVGRRRKRGCVERLVQATATHYIVSPEVLGALGPDPTTVRDRASSSYLVALAARAIRELAVLRRRADAAEKRLPTLSLHSDVRFSSQADLHAFSEELAEAVARVTAKYHREGAPGGRLFRFFLGAYPAVTKTE